MMAMYMTVLAMPEFQTLAPMGASEEFCQCEECEKGAREFVPMEKSPDPELPEVLKVDIPMKDFIFLVNKYKKSSLTDRLKDLIKG
jgi:hypothetical protein